MRKSRVDEKNLADIYGTMINEDITTGEVFGDVEGHGGDVGNEDFYAPGDARYPWLLGVQSRNGKISKKKKKKAKSAKAGIPKSLT